MKQNKPQHFAGHGQEELHSGKEYAPLHGSDSPDAFQQADGTGRHKKRRRPPLDENGKPRKRRRRPPLDENEKPRKRRRPPLDENGRPRKRRRPPLDEKQTRIGGTERRRKPVRKKAAKRRKFRFPFWIPAFVLYTVLLVWLSGKIVIRVRSYMSEYEASRPQYVMDAYIKQLDESFYEKMLEQGAANLRSSEYESAEAILSAMPADTTMHTYSYRKNADASSEGNPVYDIISGGKAIARIRLHKTDSTERYGMTLWTAGEPESLITVSAQPQYGVSVTIPDHAVLRINGHEVPASEMSEAEPEIKFDEIALKYGEQPGALHYEADGFYLLPKIEVTDAEGRVLKPVSPPAEDAALQEYIFERADEDAPDEQLLQRIRALTDAYINHVTYTGRDADKTISVLNQYMLTGGPAIRLMRTIVGDIKWNNPFYSRDTKGIEVSHVKFYSDKLCTCQVDFDISYTLFITNRYAGSVTWVMVKSGNYWYAEDFILKPPAET
ncbi:MAG: hypothetical protein IKI58_10085 [Oscillospiraceae bacterium]|nr:hypothetical protein [Oscillospiraceae bacterium]